MTQTFKLTPKQEEAQEMLAGPATHGMLFGGSRSGKTFLLVRAIIIRALKAPESRHAMLRFRFNHIKSSIVLDTFPKVMRMCFPELSYHVDKTDWYATLPGYSQIWFGGLDDKERTERILGQEHATLYLNEASQISKQSRDIALTRLAQLAATHETLSGKVSPFLKPRMFYDCNPTTKLHWTYKMFVQKVDPDTKILLPHPEDYCHMQMNPSDNLENLSENYLKMLESLPPRLRKRFLSGEYGDATPFALFTDVCIDTWRVIDATTVPEMVRIAVGVDPSGVESDQQETGDSIGICVVGLGTDGNAYLLEDCTVRAGPKVWGKVATDAYDRHEANVVVGEVNYGGAMVNFVIQTSRPRTPFKSVTATRGKSVRAEPFSALYEQGRVRHVGNFLDLEEELVNFSTRGYMGTGSPNRADALIWALAELFPGIIKGKEEAGPEEEELIYEAQDWLG